jgi:UDP-glucose 4-epimerase
MSSKKKIALIGGGGYLGRHLEKMLVSSFEIVSTGRSDKNSLQLDLLLSETFETFKQQGPYDIIFILASTMKGLGTTELRREYLDLDTLGLSSFLQFISDHQLSEKVIYTSSMTVYGLENYVPVPEDGMLKPLSTYGLSKTLGEKTVHFFCSHAAVNGVILRIPGLYGGDRTSGFIYNTIQKCLRNEPVTLQTSSLGYWETMHVNDCSRVLRSFLQSYDWQRSLEIFNIGYGTKTDIVECAFHIKKITGSSSKINAGKKGYVDFYLDTAKLNHQVPVTDRYLESLTAYINHFIS